MLAVKREVSTDISLYLHKMTTTLNSVSIDINGGIYLIIFSEQEREESLICHLGSDQLVDDMDSLEYNGLLSQFAYCI